MIHFKSYFLTSLILLLTCKSYSQDFDLPLVVGKVKKSIVPVIAYDNSSNSFSQGTGFVIGDRRTQQDFLITCEHVISLKDTITKKTIRYFDNLFVNFNMNNDSVLKVRLRVVYADEKNDFAILKYTFEGLKRPRDSAHMISLVTMPFGFLDNSDSLMDGDPVFYTGYPMTMGVGMKNYPITRTGIIAQNIDDSSSFLMDGLVQPGSSGSPVFKIYRNKFLVCGMAQSYRYELGAIRFKEYKEADRITLLNSGFTLVKKSNIMAKVLQEKFGFTE